MSCLAAAFDTKCRACPRWWNVQAAFRKWSWAGHVARMINHRWLSRLTFWRDSEWWRQQDHRTSGVVLRPMRSRQGHFSRWETGLCKFAGTKAWPDWRQRAGELTTSEWNAPCKQSASSACKSLTSQVVVEDFPRKKRVNNQGKKREWVTPESPG